METIFGCLIPEIYEYAGEGEYCVVQLGGLHVPLTDTKENLVSPSVAGWCPRPGALHLTCGVEGCGFSRWDLHSTTSR